MAAAQRAQPPLGGARDPLAGDLHGARLGAVEAAEQVQQRRLARARAAEHGDDLAALDVEVGPVEHAPGGAPGTERPHQPPGLDERHEARG